MLVSSVASLGVEDDDDMVAVRRTGSAHSGRKIGRLKTNQRSGDTNQVNGESEIAAQQLVAEGVMVRGAMRLFVGLTWTSWPLQIK